MRIVFGYVDVCFLRQPAQEITNVFLENLVAGFAVCDRITKLKTEIGIQAYLRTRDAGFLFHFSQRGFPKRLVILAVSLG